MNTLNNYLADKAATEYLNKFFSGSIVTIKRLTKDSYGKTVAEVSKEHMNVQKQIVKKALQASMKGMQTVGGARTKK